MSDTTLYKERLPKYVFKGTRKTRRSIKVVQCWYRLTAIVFFFTTIFLLTTIIPLDSSQDTLVKLCALMTIWCSCILLIYSSEYRFQLGLDGSIPTIISEDCISIPPRVRNKLTRGRNSIRKEEIDHIEIMRGRGNQHISNKSRIRWIESPIGIRIITISGKKYCLGYKPPSTVMEIANVLKSQWGIKVEDPGDGMGMGRKYLKDEVVGEYPYEDIMNMGLFEWQDG